MQMHLWLKARNRLQCLPSTYDVDAKLVSGGVISVIIL